MYRTGLIPPRLAMLGAIGGPLISVSSIAVVFGAYEDDRLHTVFSVPEGALEAAWAARRLSSARRTGSDPWVCWRVAAMCSTDMALSGSSRGRPGSAPRAESDARNTLQMA